MHFSVAELLHCPLIHVTEI